MPKCDICSSFHFVLSETHAPARQWGMGDSNNNRCEHCGRKLPCSSCEQRHRDERLYDLESELVEALEGGDKPILVWFHGTPDEQKQNLTRLAAEWPYAIDLIEPTEPGDTWGCRLAKYGSTIDSEPIAEWIVDRAGVRRDCDEEFWAALGRYFEREGR